MGKVTARITAFRRWPYLAAQYTPPAVKSEGGGEGGGEKGRRERRRKSRMRGRGRRGGEAGKVETGEGGGGRRG